MVLSPSESLTANSSSVFTLVRLVTKMSTLPRSCHNRTVSYWERAPDPRLTAYVERISFSTDPAGEPSPPIRVIPDGRIDLLVSVDAQGDGRADVFGVKTAALWAQSERPVANVAVSFRPGAAAALLGVPADAVTDRALDARELFGASDTARLLEPKDLEARGKRLEALLLARLPAAPSNAAAAVRCAVSRIEARAGQVRIAALAKGLGIGERRLERAFRAHVGVSPKTFARIARFRAAWRALERGGRGVEIALAHGYFDQPHLLRDFVAFAGDSPRRIFPSPGPAAEPSLGA